MDKEAEDTWQNFEASFKKLTLICATKATKYPKFIPFIKKITDTINNSVLFVVLLLIRF